MWTSLVGFFVFAKAVLAQTDSLIVHVEQGPVRGHRDADGGLFSFLNIPYATAPTGANKYKAPLPPPVWTETYDGSNKQIGCMQPLPAGIEGLLPDHSTMQEDCLVANIFVPDTAATNLPVMVYVHGGAYLTGAGFTYQLKGLVRSQKVIIVTFNYRLGVQGFLCLGTEDVPGNAGMKDQVALLRWVNRNIAGFGGNPDDVTISGCSAGGGSVDFLTISPMTSGLFKKAITESGAVFGCTGTQLDPIENAKLYANKLNFSNVDDFAALQEFYKTASYELLLAEPDFIVDRDDSLILFTPCVERETGDERFLDDTPLNILKNGNYQKVPLLYGFAEMEGLFRIPLFSEYKDRMNEKFSDFLPADLQFENETQKDEVAARVKEFYFGNQYVSEETILSYVDYFTDVMFGHPMLRAANLRRASMDDTIYLFEYSFVHENTPFVPYTTIRGADHCGQSFVIVDDLPFFPTNHSEQFEAMRESMRYMWLNFISTGNPTPEGSTQPPWLSVSSVNSPFMALNETIVLEQSSLLGERVRFWDSIYEEHYRQPVPPPAVPVSVPDSAASSAMSSVLIAAVLVINYMF